MKASLARGRSLGFWLLASLYLLGSLLGGAQAAPAETLLPMIADTRVFRADFEQPSAVALDGAGRLYVLDGARHRIVVIAADGSVIRSFGSLGNGPGQLRLPLDLSVSDEGVVIADTGNHRLALFRPDGSFVRVYDLPIEPLPPDPVKSNPDASKDKDIPPAKPEPLLPPEPVAVSVQDGVAYWAERRTHRICRTRLKDGKGLGCFGRRGEEPGQFQYPFQIAQDRDGYFNVVDIVNARVQVFDKTGRFFSQVGRFGVSTGELYRPNGLAIDRERDVFFVSDSYFGTISVFRKGEFAGLLQNPDGHPVTLDSPTGLFFKDGVLYVAETGGSRVLRYRVDYRPQPSGAGGGGLRVEVSQKNCVLCHLSWANEAPAAMRGPDAEGVLPEASSKMCYSCHNGAIMDSRLQIHRGAQHPVVYESAAEKKRHAEAKPRKDKLPGRFPVTEKKDLRCTSCHTPHTNAYKPETLYEAHGNSWLRVPNRGGDLCERCHASKTLGARLAAAENGVGNASPAPLPGDKPLPFDPGKRGLNHPLGIRFMAPPAADTKGFPTNNELHKGLPAQLAAGGSALGSKKELICQTCHQVHGGHGDGKMTVLDRSKGELCSACHPRQFSKTKEHAHEKGVHPVNIKRESDDPAAKPVLWKDKPEITEVGCEVCHKVHKGTAETPLFPEGITSTKQLCKNCHERQHSDSKEEAHKKGVHPVNVKREPDPNGKPAVLWKDKPEIKEVTCDTCHKVHKGSPNTSLLPEGIANAEALCKNCHERQHAEDKDAAIKKGVHPVNAELDEPVTIGKKEIKKVGCLTCHAVHKGKPNTAALVETDQHGELCSYCHKHKQTVVGTDHDLRITADDKPNAFDKLPEKSGVCGTCHTLHRGDGQRPFLFASKLVDSAVETGPDKMDESPFKRDALCINCHQKDGLAEKKVVKHFSHPYKDLVLTSNPRELPVLDDKEHFADFGRIACITCHEPHNWDAEKLPPPVVKMELSANTENREGSNRDSFLRKKGVDGTFCVDCHGLEGLTKYKFFHDKLRARNKKLEYLK